MTLKVLQPIKFPRNHKIDPLISISNEVNLWLTGELIINVHENYRATIVRDYSNYLEIL